MSPIASIMLPAELGPTQNEELKTQLLDALSRGTSVGVDAGEVRRVGIATLQLLTAFRVDAAKRGLHLQWKATSPALNDAAAYVGLTERLGLGPTAL